MLKDFGGRFYDDGQSNTGAAWHFVDPPRTIKRQLASAMLLHQHHNLLPAEALAQSFVKQVSEIIHSRGSRSRKIGRDDAVGDDVFLGFEEDALRALTMAGKATASGTSKRLMARDMMRVFTGTDVSWEEYQELRGVDTDDPEAVTQAWKNYEAQVNERRIDSGTQPLAYKDGKAFMENMLRNEEPIERTIGMLRGLTSLYYLSRPASGLVNMTVLGTNVPAAMKAFGDIHLRRAPQLVSKGIIRYTKWYLSHRRGTDSGLFEEDAWLFREISLRGWDDPLMNMEAVGALESAPQRAYRRTSEILMLCFSATERLNRGSSIAAAYYGLREKGVGRAKALTKAHEISDKANGVYGKVNQPAWARGATPGAQVARSGYMFKTFTHNYLQLVEQMVGKGQHSAAAWALVSPMLLAGPGVFAGKAALVPLIKALFAVIPGVDAPDDPEEEFYRWVERQFGDTAGTFARTGAMGGLTGINIKGSLSMDMRLPTSLPDLLGAPYSLGQDLYYGTQNIIRGDLLKGAEKLLPKMISSPLRAIREKTEGVTTYSNQPVYYGEERLRAKKWSDFLRRVLGFNPTSVSIKTERQWKERKTEAAYNDARQDIYRKVRRFILNGGDRSDWGNILLDIQEYNTRVRESGFANLTPITPATLKGILRKMDTPAKRERIRAEETKKEVPKVTWTPWDSDTNTPRHRRTRQKRTRRQRRIA